MNLGLGNLNELKLQLIASALQAGTNYDAKLSAIGSGVAKSFEKFCNRRFGYQEDTFQLPADRDRVFLPRYPIAANVDGTPKLTLVEYRTDLSTGWVTQALTVVQNVNPESGGVYFVGALGYWFEFVRLTWTGGYPRQTFGQFRRSSVLSAKVGRWGWATWFGGFCILWRSVVTGF